MRSAKQASDVNKSYESELLKNLDQATDRLLFLAEASRRLSFALSNHEAFQELVELMVPAVADWATISLLNEHGDITRSCSTHVNPQKSRLLATYGKSFPPKLDDTTGAGLVIRTRKSEFTPDFGDNFEEELRKIRYPELSALIRTLGVKSKLCVPIEAHGMIFGALLLATSESGRRFDIHDLKLAEEVARRAALAAFHLTRYTMTSQEVEKLKTEQAIREDYITQVRHDAISTLSGAIMAAQLIQKRKIDGAALAEKIVVSINRAVEILRQTRLET